MSSRQSHGHDPITMRRVPEDLRITKVRIITGGRVKHRVSCIVSIRQTIVQAIGDVLHFSGRLEQPIASQPGGRTDPMAGVQGRGVNGEQSAACGERGAGAAIRTASARAPCGRAHARAAHFQSFLPHLRHGPGYVPTVVNTVEELLWRDQQHGNMVFSGPYHSTEGAEQSGDAIPSA